MGIVAEAATKKRMRRRQHALHAVVEGERSFDVTLVSQQHRLIGKIDEVVETTAGAYLVDYKDNERDYGYWQVQMAAYRLCYEESGTMPCLGTFIYSIPTQQYHEVTPQSRQRNKLFSILETLDVMVDREVCPPPTRQRGKCRTCQYARFCNDVF